MSADHMNIEDTPGRFRYGNGRAMFTKKEEKLDFALTNLLIWPI